MTEPGPDTGPQRPQKKQLPPLLKLALEIGPLAVFFFANAQGGIFVATAAFMVAMSISIAVTFALVRHVPTLPLATGVFVLVFGGLTLWLNDDTFIKLKPTIVNALFAAILAGGMLAGRPLLRSLLDSMMQLDTAGWRILTWRWAAFFLFLAVANEVVWRNFDTDTWVDFKVFGIMPLTIIFSLAQVPLIQRHSTAPAEG
ncbi:septation protein A [Marinibaculum pumilum]|uniref:Inner membrane-spanning protein YciB n=1 Tax=Marinibaculum pumilum TaxID=1766165 RepID=A0ABV7L0P0_9PROT